ncbi:hypothetical protein Ga0080574_TMP4746 [Salipiger abyssi]|uniref:Uncharacterized protein n=1 Tax=Salipiger abyssi TaxID=1250539 RepID=A0A1P8V098_9RHOB|nr:hypothetical protein Ga0080574_TMP4746 [Salipiger abyssi]
MGPSRALIAFENHPRKRRLRRSAGSARSRRNTPLSETRLCSRRPSLGR